MFGNRDPLRLMIMVLILLVAAQLVFMLVYVTVELASSWSNPPP